MARDMAMAFCFGSAPEIAAFMVAYRLANLFRRLLGEGNLQAGFVPHFEAARGAGREELFYRDISYSLAIVLLGAVAVLEGVFALCWLTFPSWQEVISLSMWMVPGLFFICLYGLNSSYLQCQQKYFLPAVAPVAFNFVWIIACLAVSHLPKEEGVKWLSVAVTLAFGGQWLATVRFRGWGKVHLFSPEWKALLKPLSLGIVGIGAVQINSALDAIFARLADLKGPAYLWYAIRIEQLPVALFGIALSGALLPPLSRAVGEQYRQLLQTALRSSAALMLPCTFGILCLGGVGINLLYGHGDFSSNDVQETLFSLWGYGLGLVPSVFVLLLAASYYAQKSYRIPTIASLVSVIANVLLNALFVFGFGWGAVSIAIATSLSAMINAYVLNRESFDGEFWRFFFRMAFCCAMPAIFVLELGNIWIGSEYPRQFSAQVIQLAALGTIYVVSLGLLAWRFKLTELFEIFRLRRPQEEL